jgi:signal recognition particle subunit SRP54
LDGDTRGGAVLSVRAVTGKPIRFMGIGEGVDALQPFDGKRIAERILGFGDVLGLVEKVQEAVDMDQAKEIERQFKKGKLDFETLLSQFKTIKKMGSLSSILKMIPGVGALPKEITGGAGEEQMAKAQALILSMTPQERRNPDILNGSRRRRIASGAGATVQDVNRLVKSLDEMQRQMKQFSRIAGLKKGGKAKKGRRK